MSAVVVPGRRPGRTLLILAGALAIELAILHAAVIRYGPPAYRYFGAPQLADLHEKGSRAPTLITSALVAVFAVLGLYAFSGAGMIPRLPLLRTALVLASAVFLLRGSGVFLEYWARTHGYDFPWRYVAFSGAALLIGLVWAAGTIRAWRRLSRR